MLLCVAVRYVRLDLEMQDNKSYTEYYLIEI